MNRYMLHLPRPPKAIVEVLYDWSWGGNPLSEMLSVYNYNESCDVVFFDPVGGSKTEIGDIAKPEWRYTVGGFYQTFTSAKSIHEMLSNDLRFRYKEGLR